MFCWCFQHQYRSLSGICLSSPIASFVVGLTYTKQFTIATLKTFCKTSAPIPPSDERLGRHQLYMPIWKAKPPYICWDPAPHISFKTLNMVAVAKIPTRMITIAITVIFEEPTKHTGSASGRGWLPPAFMCQCCLGWITLFCLSVYRIHRNNRLKVTPEYKIDFEAHN